MIVRAIEVQQKPYGMALVRNVRHTAKLPQATFDRELRRLIETRRVTGHFHDMPTAIPKAEWRAAFVRVGRSMIHLVSTP